MQASFKQQQGLTFISLVLILSLFGFLALLVLKIGPIYLDHSKVVNALAAVEETTDVQTMSEPEIREMLRKRFDLSYVYDVTAQEVQITKSGGYLKVEIQYDVIKKIMGNLSVLVEFDDVVEVGQE